MQTLDSTLEKTASAQKKTASCPFQFIEQGAHAAIIHEGQEIVRLDKNIAYFDLAYWCKDQVMVPGGRPEVAIQPVLSAYPHSLKVDDVRYEVEVQGDTLQVRIIPTKIRGSNPMGLGNQKGLSEWREENILSVRLEDGRFVWKQQAILRFFQDVDLDAQDNGLRIYRFHHADGRPGRMFQFFDPVPAGASGPQVPMLRDWIGFPEPYTGPDGFRKHWKREYVELILKDPDGGYSKGPLNKTFWLYLTLDNRRCRPCSANGPFYLVKDTGEALECVVDAPTHYHHVCEWGMDFHAWCDLDPFARGSIIPAGTQIVCTTTYRLVDREKVAKVSAQARELKLTPQEHAFADFPAYEEPENTFTVSALDRLDASPWRPTSEGCSWLRTGGYTPGSGCLVIRNSYADTGSWIQNEFGPQPWGNPIIPHARYRLSAWVRVDEFIAEGWMGPHVGIELVQGSGPALGGTQTLIDCGWSPNLISYRLPLPKATVGWTKIELITEPLPNYILRGTVKLRFTGRGTAYFSNVRWEPLEQG